MFSVVLLWTNTSWPLPDTFDIHWMMYVWTHSLIVNLSVLKNIAERRVENI